MQIPPFSGCTAPGNRADLGNVTKKSRASPGKISLFSGGFGKILSRLY